MDVAIGALDTPAIAEPTVQLHGESALPWLDKLPGLPAAEPLGSQPGSAAVVS